MRVMITGANRGIGLELSRQLAARGEQVFATCRDPAAARDLSALRDEYADRLRITALDVADPRAIDAACAEISHHTPTLDLLINNAGVQPHGERPGTLDAAVLMDTFATNAVGPILVAQACLGLLRGGDRPCIVNVTSQMGSLARKSSGGSYSYCGSKAALNMMSKAWPTTCARPTSSPS
jgi:NAD(P)-dependent dehydrogenase (short-subunit alcohol dehydrogenase family)